MTDEAPLTIVIDTNIFKHLLNPGKNPDCHIQQLLHLLARQGYRLCVDAHGRIAGEYSVHILPIIQNREETDLTRQLLQYWMHPDRQRTTHYQLSHPIFRALDSTLPAARNGKDRYFVATAALTPCDLITNDEGDIAGKKAKIRQDTRRYHGRKMQIYTSSESISALAL